MNRTARRLLGAALGLAVLLGAVPDVGAATWYVRGGSRADSTASCAGTWGSPCRYLSRLYGRVAYGDTVDVDSLGASAPADTTTLIASRNTISPGLTMTEVPAEPLVYRGRTDAPERVKVHAIDLDTPHLVVEGFWFDGGFFLKHNPVVNGLTDHQIKVDSCLIRGNTGFVGVKGSKISNSTIEGRMDFSTSNWGWPCADQSTSQRDTLYNNTLRLGYINSDDRGWKMRYFTTQCLIERNRISATFDTTASVGQGCIGYSMMLLMYNTTYSTFRYNRWTAEANTPQRRVTACGQVPGTRDDQAWFTVGIRDSSHFIHFEQDTFLAGLNSDYRVSPFRFAQSGTENFMACTGFGLSDQPSDLSWNRCVFKSKLAAIESQFDARNLRFTNNVVHAPGGVNFEAGEMRGVYFAWNTIYSRSGPALKIGENAEPYENVFIGNIFAAKSPTSTSSVVTISDPVNLTFLRNLYWDFGAAGSWWRGTPNGWTQSLESSEKAGDPVFADTSLANFTGLLSRGSAAAESLHTHDGCSGGSPPNCQPAWVWGLYPDSSGTRLCLACPEGPVVPVDNDARNDRYVGAIPPPDTMAPRLPSVVQQYARVLYNPTDMSKYIRFNLAGDDSVYGCPDSLFIFEDVYDGGGSDIDYSNCWSYMIAGWKADRCCDFKRPDIQGGNGCQDFTWEMLATDTDPPDGWTFGSEAIIPGVPDHVSYIVVGVKDKAGNFRLSPAVTMDVY